MNEATSESPGNALARFQQRFDNRSYAAEGASWSFRDTAAGSDRIPLVMLPGAGATGDVFYSAIDRLRDSYRIVSVTYPALDDSGKLASGLLAALSKAGIERFDLFGSSLGGYLAQAVALRAPKRVRRCMFANTFYDSAWLQRKVSRDALLATPASEHLANAIRRLQAASTETPEKADFKQTMLALVGPAQTADMAKSALLAVLGAPVLPAVELPREDMAVLDCDDDPVVDLPTRQAMRERYERSPQFRLQTGGHYPALLAPTPFVAALRQHFRVD